MPGYALRVSVTERCQLNCGYCLPNNKSPSGVLTLEEYHSIARTLASISIEKIRFTGGEPLVRKDLAHIVEIFRDYHREATFALTTNGQLFERSAHSLWQAGIRAVTFHLDTLLDERYQKLMGKGSVQTVLDAVGFALELGYRVKVNVVVQRHKNDDELLDFLHFSKKYGVMVRFIEMMNTGSAVNFVAQHFIAGSEILQKLGAVEVLMREAPSDPAELFYEPETSVTFGLIASDTRPFCENCNRLRLSASGKLYTCLYDASGIDIRHGTHEESSLRAMKKILQKESFHPGLKKASRRLFSMAETGG